MFEKAVSISGVKYNVKYKIGQGQQGSVYCVESPKGELFALKRMDIINEDFRERMYQEITLHHSCKCPNIIKFIDSEQINGELYIILELGQCNLSTYLQTKQGNTLDQKQLLVLIKDISTGLVEIHKNEIIHRDIKADNIIISNSIFKISDFGVSGQGSSSKTFVGTPIYLAPEMLSNKQNDNDYNFLVDIWALGVISFESYFGVHPFYHNPKDKHVMNFNILSQNMNILIDKDGFHIDILIQKLRHEGMSDKASFIESKIRKTSLNNMNTLKAFWNRSMTLDPNLRVTAQVVMKKFNLAQRSILFQNQIKNDEFKNTMNNNSLNTSTSLTYKNQNNNISYQKVQIIPLIQIQRFLQNTKYMVLQLSNSFHSFMNTKQLSLLNPCLIALEMICIICLNKGSLSKQQTQKFLKLSRKQQQKKIYEILHEAAKSYKNLIQKYPLQHFLGQIVFRLQISSIVPKFAHNLSRLTSTFPMLFPNKISMQEYEENQHKISNSNLVIFLQQLKSF